MAEAPAWSEVAAKPDFQALPPAEKESARQQYFQQIVAPKVPQEKLPEVKAQFDEQTLLPGTDIGPARENTMLRRQGDRAIKRTMGESLADIGGATAIGGGLGAVSSEILTGLGMAARSTPYTMRIAPFLESAGAVLKAGGRTAPALAGAASGAISETAGQMAETAGAGPTTAEITRIVAGGVGPELKNVAAWGLKKGMGLTGVDTVMDALKKYTGRDVNLTAAQKAYVEQETALLRGGEKTNVSLEKVGSIMGDEGQRLLSAADQQLVSATANLAGAQKKTSVELADIGGALRDKIAKRNEAALTERARQYTSNEKLRDSLVSQNEAAGRFVNQTPEYDALVKELELELKPGKRSPDVAAGFSRILDSIRQPYLTNASSDAPGILSAIQKLGGIKNAEGTMRDITGESRTGFGTKGIPPALFRGNGLGLDDLASLLRQKGYLIPDDAADGGVQMLKKMIRDEIDGTNKHLSGFEQDAMFARMKNKGGEPEQSRTPISFQALDDVRRKLGDAFRGKPAEGFDAIGSAAAKDLYHKISNIQKQYAGGANGPQSRLLDDYAESTAGLEMFSSKFGKKATALDQYREGQYKTDTSALPTNFFRSRESIRALKELTGDDAHVQAAALQFADKKLVGKNAEQARAWMGENSEWLAETGSVRGLVDKYVTKLEDAERSMRNAQDFVTKATADNKILTKNMLPAQRAVDLINSGNTELWSKVMPALNQSPQAKTQVVNAVKQVVADSATSKGTIDLFSRNIKPFLEQGKIASPQEIQFIETQLAKIAAKKVPETEKLGMLKRILLQSAAGWSSGGMSRGAMALENINNP